MSAKRSTEHIAYLGPVPTHPARAALAAFVALAAFTSLLLLLSLGPPPAVAAPAEHAQAVAGNLAPAGIAAPMAVTNTTTTISCLPGTCGPGDNPDYPDPSVVGQSYDVFFQVAPTADTGGVSVDGTVTVGDGTGATCSRTVDSSTPGWPFPSGWQWECHLTSTSAGAKTLAATFVPASAVFNGSSDTEPHQVNPASTQTALTVSPASPNLCEPVSLTATVSVLSPGSGTPGGTVTFLDGTTVLGTATLSGGVATLSLNLSSGTHSITASYAGNSNFNGSTSSPQTVTVTKARPTVTLSASPGSPQTFGTQVTLTAEVQGVGSCGTPTGHVYFDDNGVVIGTAALNTSGEGTLVVPLFSAGSHLLKAVYESDNETYQDNESTSQTYVINRRSTTTTLVSSANPSVWGQTVTFTATVSSGIAVTPTGQVIFRDAGTVIATGTLDGSGRAVFSTADLEVGLHPITADYQGDQNFLPASRSLTQTVNKANTATVIVGCVSNPSRYGESVTCTARVTPVAPGAGIPTGQIVFKVDGTPVYTTTLGFGTPGEATYTTGPGDATTLKPVGSHNVAATYLGDNHFTCATPPCTSPNYPQQVLRADTRVQLQDPLGTSDVGQEVQFTAIVSVVSPGSGVPTGDVTFLVDGQRVFTDTLPEGRTSLTYKTTDLPIGSHTISAIYLGDANFNPSPAPPSSDAPSVTHTVNQSKSKTSLTSAPNPSNYGQTVVFTATVKASGAATAAITPTGTVTFTFPGVGVMTDTLNSSLGIATVTTSTLPTGVYDVVADYGGDANFLPSSATWRHTVNRLATTTTLTASPPGSAAVGQTVTFSATVTFTGSVTPTGTVALWDGTVVVSTTLLSTSGVATFTTSSLSVGTHPMKAVYSGTTNFKSSTSDRLFYDVTAVGSATALTSTPNPSNYGQSVTFTATVTRTDTGAPITAGTVTFVEGPTTLGTGSLNGSGQATFSTASLAAGTHPITAIFAGSASFGGSTSNVVNQVVNKVTPTVTVTDNPDPTAYSAAVTLVATVAPVPGGAIPTGTVSFTVGVTVLGTVALNGAGQATLVTSAIPAGTQTITANYSGDNNYNPASGNTTHTVNQASTTTTVTTSPNPSLPSQPVDLKANVTSGAGTVNGGTVQFYVDSSPVGSAIGVSAGVATLTGYTGFTTAGTYNVTAVYSGNSNFQGSNNNASPWVHTVAENPTDLSVIKTDSPDPVLAGENLTYTIAVANLGLFATDVTLTDSLPPEVTYLSATPSQGSCSGTSTITCNLGTVTSGGGATVTVVVHVPITTPAGTILRNTAQVSGTRPDSNPSNNTSVQETTVYRSPRFGDCNGDGAVDVGDITSIVRDIFDVDFKGTLGCDANQDSVVDAGDVPCTVLIMFEGPNACRISETQSPIPNIQYPVSNPLSAGPALALPEQLAVGPGGQVTVPVTFTANGHDISALAFSVDYDQARLSFDPADSDGDGIPDAISFNLPGEFTASVTFDPNDVSGKLDVFIADIFPPLSPLWDGEIMSVELQADGSSSMAQGTVRFSQSPRASFGDTLGRSIPGTATPTLKYRLYLPVLMR